MPSLPKILVTGATGFIGSHFVNLALRRGLAVVAMRRPGSSFRVPVAEGYQSLDSRLGDITADQLRGVDVLVHLAAAGATARGANWDECLQVNVVESTRLVNLAIDAGVSRIVVAGSYAEYGRSGLRLDPIPPDAPLEPTDPYATSKATACVAICGLARSRKFQLSYQRIFSAYGPGQFAQNFWPALYNAAMAGKDFEMTTGAQIRDFVPVEVVTEKLLHECTRSDLIPGEPRIRNLASGDPVTLRDFAETWWKKFGASGKIKFGAVPSRSNEVIRFVPLITKD